MYQVPHYIGGNKVLGEGSQLDIYDPALGSKVGQVSVADETLVDQAVDAAQAAFTEWSAMPALQRAKLLFKLKYLLDQKLDQLAEPIVREHGKTFIEAKGSIQRGIDVLEFACGAPYLQKGSYAESVSKGMDAYSLHQPLGVCIGITPFNFPAMIGLWMFPLALVTGNTFIWKPSEKNPSVAVMLAELAEQAGIPKGVLNVVHGDKVTVDALIDHPDVKAISFVGSSKVAESVYHRAINQNKRAQAFGGAKNHCIVMPDADLDEAAKAIAISAFGSAGERCMALPVVLAMDQIADELKAKILLELKEFKIGCGQDDTVNLGPLISQEHLQKVTGYIEEGIQSGAELIADGRNISIKGYENGYFMAPCVFDQVKPNMRIYQEEIFGPVLCMLRCKHFDDALQLVNEHPYGNGAAIFTRDGATAYQFAHRVQVGMVGVNVPIPVPASVHSFGGWKQSVFADVGMFGSEGIRFYTKRKTVSEKWV